MVIFFENYTINLFGNFEIERRQNDSLIEDSVEIYVSDVVRRDFGYDEDYVGIAKEIFDSINKAILEKVEFLDLRERIKTLEEENEVIVEENRRKTLEEKKKAKKRAMQAIGGLSFPEDIAGDGALSVVG